MCTSIQVEISNSPHDNDLVLVIVHTGLHHVAHGTGFLSAKASNASSLQVGEEKGQQNMLGSRCMELILHVINAKIAISLPLGTTNASYIRIGKTDQTYHTKATIQARCGEFAPPCCNSIDVIWRALKDVR